MSSEPQFTACAIQAGVLACNSSPAIQLLPAHLHSEFCQIPSSRDILQNPLLIWYLANSAAFIKHVPLWLCAAYRACCMCHCGCVQHIEHVACNRQLCQHEGLAWVTDPDCLCVGCR